MRYTNIMIDLETLGTKPGSVILSLGAVAFNLPSDRLYIEDTSIDDLPTFYRAFSLVDTARYPFTGDLDTIQWWMGQSHEARQLFKERAISVEQCLRGFMDFISETSNGSFVKIWGNGADFDNALLTAYYRELHIQLPWRYHNNRCYRTAKDLPNIKQLTRRGVHHNALDDALYQTECFLAAVTPSQAKNSESPSNEQTDQSPHLETT